MHVDVGADVVVASGVATTRTVLFKVKDNRLTLLLRHPQFPGGVEQQTFVDEAIANMDHNQDTTLVKIPRLFKKDQHQFAADSLHEFCKGHMTIILGHKAHTSLEPRSHNLERIQWYKLST
jgi:hypothetical protein